MGDYDDKRYKGKGGNLGAAFENAWNAAKEEGAEAGVYRVELKIEVENPIRSYIVVISPDG
ncbi:MAG TPA: hypothetical protein VH541_06740 [Gaiellaceae bacterium]|jgi:hypothetical protein